MNSSNLVVNKALANGRKSHEVINSGVVENVFPHVTSAQRASGIEWNVKTWWGLTNTDNYALIDPEAYQDKPTLSPYDYVLQWESAPRTANDQASLEAEFATADLFGSAVLAVDIAAVDSTIQVDVKHADCLPGGDHDFLKDGYPLRICSHSTATATDGAEVTRTISGTPTYSGLRVSITLDSAVGQAFTVAAGTRVSTMIRPTGDMEPSYGTIVKTSSGGVVDDTTYPIELDNKGTIEEDWTLTWTDATHFTLSGDTRGSMGSGTVGTEFAPVDSLTSRPLMTIPADMLSGTWTAGDTIEFTTHPAGLPIGQKRVVLAGALSLANNKATQVLAGEAAG